MEQITISTIVNADIDKVWEYWTEPEHIMKWNFASDDWECPSATNDLRTGGTFSARMQDKNTKEGFEFGGTYTNVVPDQLIEYVMRDPSADQIEGRKVRVEFESHDSMTKVTETFDPESENSIEMQRSGWQAILDNFKQYVEEH
jgi:uncharacterized protein YndB with AHSA1/START domain